MGRCPSAGQERWGVGKIKCGCSIEGVKAQLGLFSMVGWTVRLGPCTAVVLGMQSARVCSYPGLSLLPLVLWARFTVLCCAMLCCAGCSNCPCRQSNHSRPHDPQRTPRDQVWLALPSPGPSKLWNQGKRGLPTMSTLKPPTLCLFRQQHRKYHACAGIDISLQLEARHSDKACATQSWALAVEWHGVPHWLTMCAACMAHAARAPTCRLLRAPLWRAPGLAYRPGLAAAASIRCW